MDNFIIDLFNIDKKLIKYFNIVSKKDCTEFHITLHAENLSCPFCFGITHIHGYSKPKIINHPRLTNHKAIIVFKNYRYQCNECLKTFSGTNPFAFSKFHNSHFALINIMNQLSNLNYTYKMVAESNNISVTQVQRYFDSFVTIPRIKLPESIGIDEIHSRMAKRRESSYLCVMVDNEKRVLFEILPSRSKRELSRYFDKIPAEERNAVKYVTIDMWEPYKDVANKYFKNCIIAVDPFHVVKHLMDSFRRIRLNIMYQVEYGSDPYYLLKSWKDLLEKNIYLDNDPVYNNRFHRKLSRRDLLEMILEINDKLTLGYRLKEMYLNFNKNATEDNCEAWFDTILEAFTLSEINEFEDFIQLLKNWKIEILNSFKRPYDNRKLSNALSENINSQIRTYLAISKGVNNFTRFRKRCIIGLNQNIYYSLTKNLKSDKYDKLKK